MLVPRALLQPIKLWSGHSNSILTLALEKLLLWQDSYDLIGSHLGRVMN